MPRLNKQRQELLEPKRMSYAKMKIEEKGYDVEEVGGNTLQFSKNGNTIRFYPYSGWTSGSGIINQRGLSKLLDQL